jgi:hypothetical protein
MIPQSAKSKPHQTFLECALEKRDRNCAIEEGDLFNCNKKGGLFSRLQLRGEDLNLRPNFFHALSKGLTWRFFPTQRASTQRADNMQRDTR